MEGKINKSEKIRQLFDAGLSVAEISKAMGIRYQFAYNVISYHIKQRYLEGLKYVGATSDASIRVVSEKSNPN